MTFRDDAPLITAARSDDGFRIDGEIRTTVDGSALPAL
jgi:hypothetical protein